MKNDPFIPIKGKYETHLGKHGTVLMRKTKKSKLEDIKRLFQKEKVLKIDSLFKVLGTKSRRTVHRYMREMEYLTSYSHAGQYYTLFEIADFDSNELWHYGDIGFSKHGTLVDTIVYCVNQSTEGMTNSELQDKFHVLVKAALIDLVKKNKLVREKRENLYVYTSPDPDRTKDQLKKREQMAFDKVDDAIAFRVLLAAYRFIEKTPSPEKVAAFLKNEGSKISLEIVRRVLQRYGVEKKTQGSSSSNS